MGTPAFMPPEQARGRWDEVDAQSDLWSVGATLFVALSGRPLRSAPTANEELLQAMTEPPPHLYSVCREIPLALADVVDRALAFDKAARWTTAREMHAALRTALGEEAPTLHAPPPDSPPPLPGVDPAATRARPATELILSSTRSEAAAPSPDARTILRGRIGAAVVFGGIGAMVVVSAVLWSRAHARSTPSVAGTLGATLGSASLTPPAISSSPWIPSSGPADVPEPSATLADDPPAPAARPAKPRTNPSRNSAPPGVPTASATSTATAPVLRPATAPATTSSAPSSDPLSRRR